MANIKDADERFKKFGTVSFTAISKVNDFIDHLENGRVAGTRCTACSRRYFPPRADCCGCLASGMEWFEVAGKGRLVSYSRLQFAPVGFQDDVPYCIALLDYGDFKVFGRIAPEIAEEELEVGMQMVTAVHRLASGQLTYVFKKY
jgi:uncharacterized OB-fold protein